MIGKVISGVIRKKLEDYVLETMDDPENLKTDFFEVRDIARERGFGDIVSGFDEVLREVGEIQAKRTIEKVRNRELRREEAEFEQYLINYPETLEKIEKGLKYVSSQKRVKSGRLDILAQDSKEENVKVELKAREYDVKRTAIQLMAYLNEDDKRVIFVAPEVNPQLVFALKAYSDAGKLKFVQSERTNGDYSFREVTPESIEEPKPINWGRKRKEGKPDKIRVTSAASRAVGLNEVKSEEEERWENMPFYYQMLCLNRPQLDVNQRKKYLNPVEISVGQMRMLESLVDNPVVTEAHNAFNKLLSKLGESSKNKKNGRVIDPTPKQASVAQKSYPHYMDTSERISKEILNIFYGLGNLPARSLTEGSSNGNLKDFVSRISAFQMGLKKDITNARYSDDLS